MPRSTLFAYMIFKIKNEINESYKLCQVRGNHTVGDIVFYKHLFLVHYAPNFEKVGRAYCFRLVCVCVYGWVGGWVGGWMGASVNV